MRLATISTNGGARAALVRKRSDGSDEYVDLHRAHASLPTTLKELLALPQGLEAAEAVLEAPGGIDAGDARVLAPIPNPRKIICIGLNYADHAAETGAQVGEEPVVFNKFPTAIGGPGDPVVLPQVSQKVDYEAELVVVIGRGGRHIPREEAFQHIAGFTCGHDVSARDWQTGKPGGQWLLGKTFDSFAPIGPHLVTPDEIADPHDLRIQMRINGQVMQDSTTAQLIFRLDYLIAYLSQVCTFEPGDLIFTGTPPGVGVARKPQVFLKAGDTAEVCIEGIGTLTNPVVAEDA